MNTKENCHLASQFTNMIFKRNKFLFLLQHLVLISSAQTFSTDQQYIQEFLETDRAALMEFKKTITSDPTSVLANWNETTHTCNFKGVKCNKLHHRVEKLRLLGVNLVGPLSPFISNLSRLRVLKLSDNHLFGIIPPEFTSLRYLRKLQLDGNNLHGPIPNSLSLIPNLSLIMLTGNNLTGTIPPSLFFNCTSLLNVDLSQNSLSGEIPVEIGNCPNIWNLNLYNNQFTGQIPFSLTNASLSMYNLDVEYNHLSGELPSKIIAKLPELSSLHLSYNSMVSHNRNTNLDVFFSALTNSTALTELELAGMQLGGRLPSSFGQLSASMENILLQENQIFGSIPPLGNLSSLMLLNLTYNRLNGTVSPDINRLQHLERLLLSHNSFTGEIPTEIGQIPHLGLLDLSYNRFSGKIPESLGNLVRINSLFLNNNILSGEIPPSLGECTDLYILDLSYNRLTGTIPSQISRMREIRIFLNLSHNRLEGPLPIEVSKLENVQAIDLSSNNLSGNIFVQISSCIALRMLNLSNNFLHGKLPESLGDLKSLEVIDVSTNNLSGKIPTTLSKIHTLSFLNLSSNKFSGAIPSGGIFGNITNLSLLDNPGLCGLVPINGIPICHDNGHCFHSQVFLITFCIVISVSVILSIICCVIAYRRLKGMITSGKPQSQRKSTPDLVLNFPRITYKELSDATGGFDDQRLIGSGGYGRVYRGVLRDGTPIAVKVLQLQTGNSTKSFSRECQVLKRIRHRNLIRIVTACSLPDFKALVLPYMANGSLDICLYPHQRTGLGSGSSDLGLIQRVNICNDIAEGMAYLHHHSPVRVIHCDLKPSNVLLNDDMTALVSDFGISRLVMTVGVGNAVVVENMGTSTANMLCGSIGYIAPGRLLLHFCIDKNFD